MISNPCLMVTDYYLFYSNILKASYISDFFVQVS